MVRRLSIALLLAAVLCLPAICVAQPAAARQMARGCARATPALPLHTQGRWIVDANGNRFKLNSVNWYGAEEKDFVPAGLELEPLETIVRRIRCMGFNSVRLPWSNELFESNPAVSASVVAMNPQFAGMRAMDVFDAVVNALAHEGLLVILDNHMSNADWCCSNTDGNTLWYNAQYRETSWIADWKGMVARYKDQPAVIGADLRNEPRHNATWGGNPATDWRAAAERGGDAVLSVNPNLLIFVEGVNYAADLTGVASVPVRLDVPHRLVYSAHDYSFYHNGLASPAELAQDLEKAWGYIATPDQRYTAPLWVGEFGTCHTSSSCLVSSKPGPGGFWFSAFLDYLRQKDVSWSYWAVNGTEARGTGRRFGSEETYGILDPYWNAPALPDELNPPPAVNLLGLLQTVMEPTQGPGVLSSYPPKVAITNPVPGALISSGETIIVSADAAARNASPSKVDFYANGRLIGAVTASPFTIHWTPVRKGRYTLTAVAKGPGGGNRVRQASGPVTVHVEDYVSRNVHYSASIAINFGDYNVSTMQPSELAGVVPQSHWNGAYGNSGAVSSLVENDGTMTDASVTWSATNMYFTSAPDLPGNDRMMKGYLDNTNTVPTTITVSNLPRSFRRYDVYVYFNGGNGRSARAANFRIVTSEEDQNGDPTHFSGCPDGDLRPATIISGLDAANSTFSGTFTLAAGGSAGNYVIFPDCHGRSFTLLPVHGASADSQVRAPVNGIQIIARQTSTTEGSSDPK